MKALILAALALLTLDASVHAQSDAVNTIRDTPHVTIVGSANVEVASDLAIITLGVVSHKPSAAAAADTVAVKAKAVLDAAKALGIADLDIATQSLTISQTSEEVRDPQGRFLGRKPTGFDAVNKFAIRIHDLPKAGAVAQTLIDKGANAFDGIQFTVENPQPILAKLSADAVTNARRQAELVAQAAGVQLSRVLLIERTNDRPPPVYVPPPLARAAEPKEMPLQSGTTSFEVEMKVIWSIAR